MAEALHSAGMTLLVWGWEEERTVWATENWCRVLNQLWNFTVVTCVAQTISEPHLPAERQAYSLECYKESSTVLDPSQPTPGFISYTWVNRRGRPWRICTNPDVYSSVISYLLIRREGGRTGKLCNTVLGMLTGYLLTAIKVCTGYMYTLRATLFPSQLKKNISPPVKQPENKAKSHNPDNFSAIWYDTTCSTCLKQTTLISTSV